MTPGESQMSGTTIIAQFFYVFKTCLTESRIKALISSDSLGLFTYSQ